MIHNHEVPGSIPGLATETEKVERLSPFFVFVFLQGMVEERDQRKILRDFRIKHIILIT